MEHSFILDEAALRRRGNLKWTTYGPEILPAFVAEMDYAVAPAVHEALTGMVETQGYGYPALQGGRTPEAAAQAFTKRMRGRFGWNTDSEMVVVCSDIVQAIFATMMAFSAEGEGVVVPDPCYPPFRQAAMSARRTFMPIPIIDDGMRYVVDVEGLRKSRSDDMRLLILCNPHNPTGRVFTREELQVMADFACERDLIVVSDEVHADIVFDGRRHIPFASLNRDIAERTITLCSAAKAFNLAGLKCAFIHFGAETLLKRFLGLFPRRVITPGHVIGIDATLAAWGSGMEWQAAVLNHVGLMRDEVMCRIAADMPGIRCHEPEGTYMAWLDCRNLHLAGSASNFFLEQAYVALGAGETFTPDGKDFVRLNFATSRKILDRILDRMASALPSGRD